MVTMEELIRLQKREEAAQKAAAEKEKQAALKTTVTTAADQVPPAKSGQSAAKKSKEKGITISEGGPQATRSAPVDNALQSKKDGRRGWGSRLRLHRPLGNVRARVEMLQWFPSVYLRLRVRSWWFILTRCLERWCLSNKMLPFQAKGPLHFLTTHCMR